MSSDIDRLADAVMKGTGGIGMERFLVPSAVEKVRQAVNCGDARQITAILLEVAGDAISIAAGRSPGGAPAIYALAEAIGPSLAHILSLIHI